MGNVPPLCGRHSDDVGKITVCMYQMNSMRAYNCVEQPVGAKDSEVVPPFASGPFGNRHFKNRIIFFFQFPDDLVVFFPGPHEENGQDIELAPVHML